MVKTLAGKYGLIIGGNSGLGYASAQKLAANGMNLILVYRDARMNQEKNDHKFAELEEQGVRILTINTDATREKKIDTALEQIREFLGAEKLHLSLHSLSRGNLKSMTGDDRLTTDDFLQTINSMGVNLYTWCERLQKQNLLQTGSRILSFTSEGSTRPMESYAAVSAAKATLEAITRNLAKEYGKLGITANCIQAGVTVTDSLQRIPNSEELIKASKERNPMKKLTTPEQVGDVVYLMCLPESSWINGTVIKVDGGESL
jgi:enoyl-[acyl-carrier protein] reductase I